MALETKPAKDPAAEDKHELDPKRKAALDTALAQVEKSFGKGSAMRLGDQPEQNVEVIPTGSLALDMALGIGGLPKGRIVEIYGPESSGKTTLALHVVANAQKKGGVAAYIDAEHALDPAYARKLGVDTDSLIVSQPDNGEQALEIADMLIRSGALDVIVIDSVAALVPKAEIEGEMGDSHVGLQARLMSQALRKMTGALAQAGTTASVSREMHTGLPASLSMRISQTCVVRPTCSARAVPVTLPVRVARRWLALISSPTQIWLAVSTHRLPAVLPRVSRSRRSSSLMTAPSMSKGN